MILQLGSGLSLVDRYRLLRPDVYTFLKLFMLFYIDWRYYEKRPFYIWRVLINVDMNSFENVRNIRNKE